MASQPASGPSGVVRFGACELDPAARELRVGGAPVEVERGTFDVLVYLVAHRDRVVPKEELLDEVWGDRFVSESALTTRIKHARAAIGDDGRSQGMIKTVHRVGYRFVAEVSPELPAEPTPTTRPARPSGAWAGPAWWGREEDLATVRDRLAGRRLVTVTGPAGVGKTTLARHLRAVVSGPVWFCELADTRDPSAIPNVVLDALGEAQQSGADPVESVLRVLETQTGTLVVDNCEHVVAGAAALVRALLDRCPELRVLATGREPLGVEDEVVHDLAPLDPEAAIACFTARAADAGGVVDPADPALGELCRRLDGIPLALELAAARARLLTPSEMLDLLADRFRLLRGPDEEGDATSLQAAIGASWDALAAGDRELLSRLGVFVGGFTIDDARAVAMPEADALDVVDGLERLVRRSLLTAGRADRVRTRFRLLESVRDFALDRLVDPAALHRAHCDHFLARAERLDAECQTTRIDEALAGMREIWPNLRAAVGWAVGSGDLVAVRRIVRAVAEYADVFGVYEVGDWCARAGLDGEPGAGEDVGLAADALAVWARMLAHQGELEQATARAATARSLHESHATLLSVVWCAYYTGRLDEVVEAAPRLVELSRSARGFDRGYADGFAAIVTAVRQEVDLTESRVDPGHLGPSVLDVLDAMNEGLRLCTVDPGRAAALLESVVETSVERDYRLLLGAAASTLTQITGPARPRPEAMATLRRTLQRYRERNMWNLISADIVMAARFVADEGEPRLAARLLGSRQASGYASGLSEILALLVHEELAARLGDEYVALVAEGRGWRPPEAAARAIEGLSRALGESPDPVRG